MRKFTFFTLVALLFSVTMTAQNKRVLSPAKMAALMPNAKVEAKKAPTPKTFQKQVDLQRLKSAREALSARKDVMNMPNENTGMKRAQKAFGPDVPYIFLQPEGTQTFYEKSGDAYFVYIIYVVQASYSGAVGNVVFGSGNEVGREGDEYFVEPLTYDPASQWYIPADTKTMTLNYDAKTGAITTPENSPYATGNLIIGLVDSSEGWTGYADWNLNMTVFDDEPMAEPENVTTETYSLSAPGYNGSLCNVGFSGDDVYVQGLYSGLPDAWELKYGLNPNDPADAKKDSDGDTFTNLEEFEAKTDPKNPDSHPDFLDFLALASALRTEELPFMFKMATPIPNGHRLTFVATKWNQDKKPVIGDAVVKSMATAEVGKEVVFELMKIKYVKGRPQDDKVKTGWRVLKYNKKEDRVLKPGTEQKVLVDVSTADLERISDKRTISVQIGVRKPVAIEEQIDLVWNRGEGKKFTVTAGSEFTLANRKYKVKKFAKDGNACKVTIEDLDKKTEKIIQ